MVAKTLAATHVGVDGIAIEVQAASQNGNPMIHVTGLPGAVVRESRERVRVALASLGFEVPSGRTLLHLLPAHAPKQGSHFDLAMAMSALGAESYFQGIALSRVGFLGELTLDARIRPVAGVLALAQCLASRPDVDWVIVPEENGAEVGLLGSPKIRLAGHLGEVLDFLRGRGPLGECEAGQSFVDETESLDLDQVLGNALAKRALQVALAGRHHLLMVGPPGVGKTLLAQSAPSLLPPLAPSSWLEVVKNYVHAPAELPVWGRAPFRSPHHTISGAALLGGGSGIVIPGEVTLAHEGILFLDEFPEFRKEAMEGLREPLQNGKIHLHRIGHAVTLPARFTLIAAMNPCPCGHSLGSKGRCRCSTERLNAYRRRLSGPILDRFDLCVVVGAGEMVKTVEGLSKSEVVESVRQAGRAQAARYSSPGMKNGEAVQDLEAGPFALGGVERVWFDALLGKSDVSFRSAFRSLRVARTLADLDGKEKVEISHLREAWSLRCPSSHERLFGQ
jgi:magnesium chelatase family protein